MRQKRKTVKDYEPGIQYHQRPGTPSQQTLMRREQITRMVADRGQVGVEELSELFSVSSVTIRNDLNHLNQKGLLIRSRGGAMARQTSAIELPVKEKQSQNQLIKTRLQKPQ